MLCRPRGHEICSGCRASGMLPSRTSPRQCWEWPAGASHSAVHAGELADPLYGRAALSSSVPISLIYSRGVESLSLHMVTQRLHKHLRSSQDGN